MCVCVPLSRICVSREMIWSLNPPRLFCMVLKCTPAGHTCRGAGLPVHLCYNRVFVFVCVYLL